MTGGVFTHRPAALLLGFIVTGLLLATGCSDKQPPAPPPKAAGGEAAPAEPPKEPPSELKPKWEVGKRYLIREETVQAATMTVPNQPQPVLSGNTVNRDFALTILRERPEGGLMMEAEFGANKIEVRMGDRLTASFDSASDPKTDRTNALAKLHRKTTGSKFTYVTDMAGKIERLEGVSNLVRKLTLGLDRNMSALIKAQYSEEQLKRLGLLPEGLPDRPVSPGDSWTNQFEVPISAALAKFEVQSTLSGYEERNARRCAIIKNTGTAKIELGNTPAAAAMQFENVKLEGETVYDVEKSLYVSASMTMSLEIKLKAGGQEVTQTATIKTSKAIVEVIDAPKAAEPAMAK